MTDSKVKSCPAGMEAVRNYRYMATHLLYPRTYADDSGYLKELRIPMLHCKDGSFSFSQAPAILESLKKSVLS